MLGSVARVWRAAKGLGVPETVGADESEFAVNDRVRLHAGTSEERWGTIVEDFGDDAGYAVNVGGHQIADAGRRWAITLDNGYLTFANSCELTR